MLEVRADLGIGDDEIASFVPYKAVFHGNEGNDILTVATHYGELYGDGDNDVLQGGPGMDVLYPGWGNDVVNGGANEDTIHFYNCFGVRVDLRTAAGKTRSAEPI